MGDFETVVREGAPMLIDGGIETRVMFETDVGLPPHVEVAALVDDPADAAASPAPLFYSISCVHASIAAGALRDEAVFSNLVARRLNEFKANVSSLSPEDLVRLDHPEGDEPERFAAEMWEIHEDFGLRVLGGCCGTDDRHMRALALRMAATGRSGAAS